MTNKRIPGQIWVGKEKPNVLKYYADGTEYWTVTATTHVSSGIINKGQLVAVDEDFSTGERIRPAIWPKDSNRIVGMALNSTAGGAEEVKVSNYGYIDLVEEELEQVFPCIADLNIESSSTAYASSLTTVAGGNGWEDSGIGKPVYWFVGRTLKTSSTAYKWEDPTNYPGTITFATPAGYQPNLTEIPYGDDSFNIYYKNLPQIGTIVSYEKVGNKVTHLVLHINFSTFDSSIKFSYPAKGLSHYGSSDVNKEKVITLHHGLFPNCDICIPIVTTEGIGVTKNTLDISAGGDSFGFHPGQDSFISTDKKTEVSMLSDSEFYFKLSCEVNYNF